MVVSAVNDQRPLIKVWHEPWISLSIIGWGLITYLVLEFFYRQWLSILLFLIGSFSLVALICYVFFQMAYWLPLIPPLITIWIVGIGLAIFDYELGRRIDYQTIHKLNQKLKEKLDERQTYKESTMLANRFSESLIEPLQTFLNFQPFLLEQEEKLTEKIRELQAIIACSELKLEIQQTLTGLVFNRTSQFEVFELICFKLINYFPQLDPLVNFPMITSDFTSPNILSKY